MIIRTKHTNYIFSLIYKLIVILGVYDGIRSKFVYGAPFTYLKELSVFVILLAIFVVRSGITMKEFKFSNIPMVIYLLSLGTIVIFINDIPLSSLPDLDREATGGLVLHLKTIEAFLLIFIMFVYKELTSKNVETLIRFFVQCCVWYVPITLILYFVVPESIILKPWWGRISVGYPTFDTQMLCYALLLTLFKKSLFSKKINVLYIATLIAGILMNNTGSAYAMTGVIFAFYFGRIIATNGASYKSFIIIFLLVALVSVAYYIYNYSTGNFGYLLRLKIDHILYKITGLEMFENDYSSEEIRDYQQLRAFTIKNSILDYLLGGYITIAGVIENQYGFLLRAYGYIGIFAYYSWLVYLSIIGFLKRKYGDYYLLFITAIIYFVGTLAVPNTYSYGISLSFGLLIVYFTQNKPLINAK